MSRAVLTLPWPPTLNTYWRNVSGRVLVSAKGRAYRSAVLSAVRQGRSDMAIGSALLGPLRADLRLFPPRAIGRGRWDLDNRFKAVFDAIQAASVIEDDSQIIEIHGYKDGVDPDCPKGRVEIELREMLAP